MDPEAARLHRLGAAALRDGRLAEAEAALAGALARAPDDPDIHGSLALLCHRTGRWAEAAAHGQRFLAAQAEAPDPAALLLVGDALNRLGRAAEAVPLFARIAARTPQAAGAWFNLGTVCAAAGQADAALRHLDRAIALDPGMVAAHHRIAAIHYLHGDAMPALAAVGRGLLARETAEGRALFAQCLQALAVPLPAEAAELRALAARALAEPWGRPADIAPAIVATLRADGIATQAPEHWAGNAMLLALLGAGRIADAALEAALVAARARLLALALAGTPVAPALRDLACALARHGFLNEYVHPVAADEAARVARLRGTIERALAEGQPVDAFALAMLGAYRPLGTLAGAAALPGRDWAAPVAGVIALHILEPMEEQALRGTIPRLTPIAEGVSRAVRAQYEANPYPRWAQAAPATDGGDINTVLRNLFPHAPFRPLAAPSGIDILVAGCGTGRVAQEIAQRFATSGRVLAIDLSRASLAYGARQARRHGVAKLEYAQADILALPALGLRFDLIDASGVLHHMADPFAAWRTLLAVLRPGGCMRVGLYSALGRQDVAAARAHIARRGHRPEPDDIRTCRQEILAHPDPLVRMAAARGDFYSLSECRDLLFHVHEVPMHLPDIAAFLQANNLAFLGFDLPAATLALFATSHPDPAAQSNLDAWIAFEHDHNLTFSGMYQFWIQQR